MLATLCATVHRWRSQGRPVDAWLAVAEAVIASDPPRGRRAEAMEPDELHFEVKAALDYADTRVIPTQDRFTRLLRAISLLDDWHEPLSQPSPGGVLPTAAHERALLQLSRRAGYNVDSSVGMIIPLRCSGVAAAPRAGRKDPPNSALHSTTFVPPFLAAGNADGEDLAPLGRVVAARYQAPSLLRVDPRPAPGPNPVVAVAPVHQEAADASVVIFDDPARYGLAVEAGLNRLPTIFARAVGAGAHLVFLPEMAVEEQRLDDLADVIRSASLRHLHSSGQLPALRYVVAGCVSRAEPSNYGRNFVVVLDHEGVEIARQHKLTRWNLKSHHQVSYGLRPVPSPGGAEIFENIAAGEEVWIVDLPGIGRLSTLICADMSHEQPGDFLVRSVDLDWLHAPIMDRTNKLVKASVTGQPWMIDRAVAAARSGVRRVVVTNSMLFTALINVTNSKPGSHFAPYPECSVAFMLDNDGKQLRYRDVVVDLPSGGTIVEVAAWSDGFEPFPPT